MATPMPSPISHPTVPRFFGRDSARKRLVDFLSGGSGSVDGNVCVIHGEPGSGKTELLLYAREFLRADYPDAQIYINLNYLENEPLRLEKTIARIIHALAPFTLLVDDLAELRKQYLALLEGKRVLMLLDDVFAADLVSFLAPPEDCALIFAAADRFESLARKHISLQGLDAADAASVVGSSARIGIDTRRIAELCGRQPLALRLSAALLDASPSLTVKQLADELQDTAQHAAVKNGSRVIPARLVERIYALQSPRAQEQLRQLSILRGGFSQTMAMVITAVDGNGATNQEPVHSFLEHFIALGFLRYDEQSKWFYLHPVVRKFAASRLENQDAVWLRLANFLERRSSEFKHLAEYSSDGFVLGLGLFDDYRTSIDEILGWVKENAQRPDVTAIALQLVGMARLFGRLRFLPKKELEPWFAMAGESKRIQQLTDTLQFEAFAPADAGKPGQTPFNMGKANIVLTGFMGSGKTTVGRHLAQLLGYQFIDTDELIEARLGRSISEIFAEMGEAAFREIERGIAQEISTQEKLVISTGGRLMLDPVNVEALSRQGRVFCLVATPQEILTRVSSDSTHKRPLLAVPNPEERIVELLQERSDKYRRFPQVITDQIRPLEVAQNLRELVNTDPEHFVIEQSTARYGFIVGAGLLPFFKQLADLQGPAVVVTERQVRELYGPCFTSVERIIELPGEGRAKNLASAETVYEQLLEIGFDRTGTIISLGGSAVGDVAGFVAATYMRGVNLVHCPTSLIAMVDTSIGGKTGLDMPAGKNIIGVYKQPGKVIADVTTLQTLPPRAFSSGMAEVVKHGLLAKSDLLEEIERGVWNSADEKPRLSIAELQTLVAQAIQVKISIVQEDPFERGRRSILNLGHTFGYAIEQVSHNALTHGEGVGLGLVAAANLSARLGYLEHGMQRRIEAALAQFNLPIRIPRDLSPEALLQAMHTDKKKQGKQIYFVLLRGIGDVFVADNVPHPAILETLHELEG